MTRDRPDPADAPFALLLTHDVDRPYKTYQSLFYALTADDWETRRYHLSTLRPDVNPYWQFETIADLEDDLGVRSAFYVLTEQSLFADRPLSDWLSMEGWSLYAGRYDVRTDDRVRETLARLQADGWEVGLHGSYESYQDPDRLRAEKAVVEDAFDHTVVGGRQHYLNLDVPATWRYQRAAGLRYDASLGSSAEYGFQHGYGVQRPFEDEFVVFPLTVMEQALPDPGADFERAWTACEDVLEEAREHGAVATVLWHPRHFHPREFPGYGRLYRQFVQRALDMGAWVGPPAEYYEAADLATPGAGSAQTADD